MTNLDIMARILAEASGRPESLFRRSLLAAIEAGIVSGDRLMAPAKPGALQELRGDLPTVRQWLATGRQMATRHRGHRLG